MKAKRYVQMPEKAFVKLEKAFKTECCDCQLVHVWQLTRRKGVFGFMIERDNRATAQRRRKRPNSGLHRTEPAAGSGTVRGLVGRSESDR